MMPQRRVPSSSSGIQPTPPTRPLAVEAADLRLAVSRISVLKCRVAAVFVHPVLQIVELRASVVELSNQLCSN